MKGTKQATMAWLLADRPDDLYSWYAFLATYEEDLTDEELNTIVDTLLDIYIPFVLLYFMERFKRFCSVVNAKTVDENKKEEV